MLTLAALKNMKIEQFDVKMAFLNEDLIEKIYTEVLKEITRSEYNKVCKLRKSVYKLKQVSQIWNCKFDLFLKRFHFVPSKVDACVYTGLQVK